MIVIISETNAGLAHLINHGFEGYLNDPIYRRGYFNYPIYRPGIIVFEKQTSSRLAFHNSSVHDRARLHGFELR